MNFVVVAIVLAIVFLATSLTNESSFDWFKMDSPLFK